MRLDQFLAAGQGSRTRAADAIKQGRVQVNGKTVTRPAFEIDPDQDQVEVAKAEHDYVSRAGGKLLAAYDAFGLNTGGQTVLDIGASTGGFTQCALEHGARKVYALDVGHLQLSEKLDKDPRVVKMEGVNARTIQASWFNETVDFVCMDVSFISALAILEPFFAQFVPQHMVLLCKPQFECGPKALNKKGVIRHPKYEKEALEKLTSYLRRYYGRVQSIPSPVVGRKGNQEYIIYADRRREGKA